MGKTRDLFKKTGDSKGIFPAKKKKKGHNKGQKWQGPNTNRSD